jgi:hypothetical protein
MERDGGREGDGYFATGAYMTGQGAGAGDAYGGGIGGGGGAGPGAGGDQQGTGFGSLSTRYTELLKQQHRLQKEHKLLPTPAPTLASRQSPPHTQQGQATQQMYRRVTGVQAYASAQAQAQAQVQAQVQPQGQTRARGGDRSSHAAVSASSFSARLSR